ncbi:hypothetical protein SLS62_000681 [Diatrype stigma]|uniref:Transmembrane protein n=1 Tax=Diatrype stigma TaxID=117547 RepID=A0AAN9UX16_9PEZI
MPALNVSELLLSVRSPDVALDPSPGAETNGNADNANGEAPPNHAHAATVVAVVVFVSLIVLALFFSAHTLLLKKRASDEEQDVELQLPDYNNYTRPLPPPLVRTERRPFPAQEPTRPIEVPRRRASAATRPVANLPARYPRQGNSLDIGDPNVTRASRLETSSRLPHGRRHENWPLRVSAERVLAGGRSSPRAAVSEADVAAQIPLPSSYASTSRDSFEQVDLTPPKARASSRLQEVMGTSAKTDSI